MKTIYKLKIFGLLMAMPFVTNALDCPSSDRILYVSGTVDSTIRSFVPGDPNYGIHSVQSGVMYLKLSDTADPSDDPLYEEHCGLIGKVIEVTPTGETKLDHTIICSVDDSFDTSEDLATFLDGGLVHEVISNIEQGKGLFKNMKANISAISTASFTPGPGSNNEFNLSGTVCLKRREIEALR